MWNTKSATCWRGHQMHPPLENDQSKWIEAEDPGAMLNSYSDHQTSSSSTQEPSGHGRAWTFGLTPQRAQRHTSARRRRAGEGVAARGRRRRARAAPLGPALTCTAVWRPRSTARPRRAGRTNTCMGVWRAAVAGPRVPGPAVGAGSARARGLRNRRFIVDAASCDGAFAFLYELRAGRPGGKTGFRRFVVAMNPHPCMYQLHF